MKLCPRNVLNQFCFFVLRYNNSRDSSNELYFSISPLRIERQLGLFSFLILKCLELPCWIETHSLNYVFLCMCVHLCACVYILVCMCRGWGQLEVCFFNLAYVS